MGSNVLGLDDERTPLLQPPPLLPRLAAPTPASNALEANSIRSSRAQIGGPRRSISLEQFVRAAAALKAGHLPSTAQLSQLINLALTSNLLESEPGSEPRPFASRLSRSGQYVKTCTRDWLQDVAELVENRNPSTTDGSPPGDAWQQFIWTCRETQVHVEQSIEPTQQTSSKIPTVSSSVLTLVTLFFTSPEVRKLVIDLVLLVQDIAHTTLETEIERENLPPEAGQGLEAAVDALTAKTVDSIGIAPAAADNTVPGDPPLIDLAQPEEQSATALPRQQTGDDDFVDRFKAILVRIQTTKEYQQAMRTLIDVVRTYMRESFSRLAPKVSIEPSSVSKEVQDSPSSPWSLLLPLLSPFMRDPDALHRLDATFQSTLSHLSPSNDRSEPHRIVEIAQEMDTFLTRSLLEPEYPNSTASYRTLEDLNRQLSKVGTDYPEFCTDLRAFLSHLVQAIESIVQDEYLTKFFDSGLELTRAMEAWAGTVGVKAGQALSGPTGFVGAFYDDVLEWLFPRILGILQEIPIPRIEFDSPTVTGAIEFPSLLATSFVPAKVTIRNSTSITYLPSHGTSTLLIPIATTLDSASQDSRPRDRERTARQRTSYASRTEVDIEGMRLEILDVGYFVKLVPTIPCLPTFTESGLLDLHFGQSESNQRRKRGGFDFKFDTTSIASTSSLWSMLPDSTVALNQFDVKLHDSTRHGWILWFLRPIIRPLIKKAIERELRQVVIEKGDELGRWLYKVKRHKLSLEQEEDGRKERGQWSNWIKALWHTFSEGLDKENAPEEEEEQQEEETKTAFHLNRHGVAIDLPRPVSSSTDEAGATVGIGTEGVVIPRGEAEIPDPDRAGERVGIVRKAKQEVDEAVQSGREAAQNTWNAVGRVGEASEEWAEDINDERVKYRTEGWRSDSFNFL
ncbi:uncharacterized protein JCM15063_005480 [Sporobolomyces koalae]|uniref:uncharacterized protein n=1 Tax=Sporobolomyces koalae TaxID=500713 RepID=UPI003174066A